MLTTVIDLADNYNTTDNMNDVIYVRLSWLCDDV